jgi:DNA mismatch endonuclease, patch repair protein
MSKIRSKNTSIELAIFKELKRRGLYFRRHYCKIIGTPDISMPTKKKAVFIDGDFWHGYNFKKLKKRLPKVFWIKKIERNIERDKTCRRKLRKEGWKVLRIWEHEIEKDLSKIVEKIEKFLK